MKSMFSIRKTRVAGIVDWPLFRHIMADVHSRTCIVLYTAIWLESTGLGWLDSSGHPWCQSGVPAHTPLRVPTIGCIRSPHAWKLVAMDSRKAGRRIVPSVLTRSWHRRCPVQSIHQCVLVSWYQKPRMWRVGRRSTDTRLNDGCGAAARKVERVSYNTPISVANGYIGYRRVDGITWTHCSHHWPIVRGITGDKEPEI